MKKGLIRIFMVIALIFVCGLGFSGCNENENPIASAEIIYKATQEVVGASTIKLEYGELHSLTNEDFDVVTVLKDGTRINIGGSLLDVQTNMPAGVITPVGSYELTLSCNIEGTTYGGYYTVEVVKKVKKPSLNQTTFMYTGDKPNYTIMDFDSEAMYIEYESDSYDVGSNNEIAVRLNPYYIWDDGDDDEILVLHYSITGQTIKTPTLKDEYKNGLEFNGDYNRHSGAYMFNDFDDDIMTIQEFQLLNAGTYEVYIYIQDPLFVFENGENYLIVEIVVHPIQVAFPEFEKVFTFDASSHYAVKGHSELYYVSGNISATDAGDYTSYVYIHESFKESCSFIEETIPSTGVIYDEEKDWYVIDWVINPKVVRLPEIVDSAYPYTYDGTIKSPFENLIQDGFYISSGSVYEEYLAGEYTTTFVLHNYNNITNYVWEDSSLGDEYELNWEIKKAELVPYGTNGFLEEYHNLNDHYIGKNFTISDVKLERNRFKLSTYTSEENLKADLGLSSDIAWQLNETQDKSGYTLKKYSFTDQDDIIWVKELKDYPDLQDEYLIYQTIDLSNKQIGDTQVLYLTYIPFDTVNYNEKVGIRNLSEIREKGTTYAYTKFEYNSIIDDVGTYGTPVYITDIEFDGVESPEISYTVYDYDDYNNQIQYAHGDGQLLDVGRYTIYYNIAPTEKYYGTSGFSGNVITINPLKITNEHITDVKASDIFYLNTLASSTLSGKVMVNGVEVTGTYKWVSTSTVPDVTDSEVTAFPIRFLPDSDNYTDSYKLTLTLKVNPTSDMTYKLPSITNNFENSSYIYEGQPVSNYNASIVSNYGVVKNANNEVVDGVWTIVSADDKGWVTDGLMLKFTPNDKTRYNEFTVENVLTSLEYESKYYEVSLINIAKNPDYVFKFNDEIRFLGGTLEVTLTQFNSIPQKTRTIQVPIEVIKPYLDTQYKIFYGDNAYNAINLDPVIEVKTEAQLLEAFASNIDVQTIVYVTESITTSEQLGNVRFDGVNQNFVLYVEDGVTLNFDKFFMADEKTDLNEDGDSEIYFYMSDPNIQLEPLAGVIINHGTINANALGTILQVRNFGAINIKESYIYVLDLYNHTDASISIEKFGILEDEEDDAISYLFSAIYGHFVNYGTIDFFYEHRTEDEHLYNDVSFKYVLIRDSYNYNHVKGWIVLSQTAAVTDVGPVTYYIDARADMSTLVVPHVSNNITFKSFTINDTYGYVAVIVDTAQEFYDIYDGYDRGGYNQYTGNYGDLWNFDNFSIVVDGEVDISNIDGIKCGTVADSGEYSRLHFSKRFKLVVTKKGHLILGEDKKIALYNEYEIENLPKIENYGKITGRIVLNSYAYNVSYSVEDYISGDGVFTYNDAIWGA